MKYGANESFPVDNQTMQIMFYVIYVKLTEVTWCYFKPFKHCRGPMNYHVFRVWNILLMIIIPSWPVPVFPLTMGPSLLIFK